jgi:hypothetical protein
MDTECTIVLPRRSFATRLERVLHDRTADSIAEAVTVVPRVSATVIPFRLATETKRQLRVALKRPPAARQLRSLRPCSGPTCCSRSAPRARRESATRPSASTRRSREGSDRSACEAWWRAPHSSARCRTGPGTMLSSSRVAARSRGRARRTRRRRGHHRVVAPPPCDDQSHLRARRRSRDRLIPSGCWLWGVPASLRSPKTGPVGFGPGITTPPCGTNPERRAPR